MINPYYENEKGRLFNGDCIEIMEQMIEDGETVDMVLCDPPYGIINGLVFSNNGELIEWDDKMNWSYVFNLLEKICPKYNSNIVLFNQIPASLEMLTEGKKYLNHECIWDKKQPGQTLMKEYQPYKTHENIYIFRNQVASSIREYFVDEYRAIGITKKQFNEIMNWSIVGGGKASKLFSEVQQQWCPPNREEYEVMQRKFKDRFLREYDCLVNDSPYNMQDQNKSIMTVRKEYKGIHPTQKPLELYIQLLLRYSKQGDTIIDFTSGSGTLAEACEVTGRHWICIELEKKYCDATVDRLKTIQPALF